MKKYSKMHKAVVIISTLIVFALSTSFRPKYKSYIWRIVSSRSSLSPQEHKVDGEYYLSFSSGFSSGFRITKGYCKKKEGLSYFKDYIDWYWIGKVRMKNGVAPISISISNGPKIGYYEMLKDKNLLNLNTTAFFLLAHGTLQLQNDTMIIDLQRSSDSREDWLTWKLVRDDKL
ncbi:MAG: hypothetical protein K0S33_2106 [Bacteroidetes bacterium]|jgi:hypothetical protein|nr:hypothetical protein [Bacteroidota bacterium]